MDASSGFLRLAARRVVLAPGRERGALGRLPERGGGVVQPEVDVAVLGEGDEDLQPGRRDAGGAEDRQPLGQRAELGVGAQLGAGVLEQLGRAWGAEVSAEGAPEGGLPGEVVRGAASRRPARPGRPPRRGASRAAPARTRRTSGPAWRRWPAGGPSRRPAEVLGQRRAPRLVAGGLDDLEQRPGQACRSPRLHARGVLGRDGLGGVVEHPGRATGTGRWRTPRRRPRRQAHAPTAAPATARPPWPARRRPRRRRPDGAWRRANLRALRRGPCRAPRRPPSTCL